jgi:hypothetical protein
MDSPALALYHDLYAVHGLHLEADGDEIRYRPASRMTPELLEGIRLHKAELLEILRLPSFEGLPRASCPSCGGTDLWLGARGLTWLCVVCTPPASPGDVRIRHESPTRDELLLYFTVPVPETTQGKQEPVDDMATQEVGCAT